MNFKLTYKLEDKTFEEIHKTKEEAEDAALIPAINGEDFGYNFYDFRINGKPADLCAAKKRNKLKIQGLS
jgi:hypothetical protein